MKIMIIAIIDRCCCGGGEVSFMFATAYDAAGVITVLAIIDVVVVVGDPGSNTTTSGYSLYT